MTTLPVVRICCVPWQCSVTWPIQWFVQKMELGSLGTSTIVIGYMPTLLRFLSGSERTITLHLLQDDRWWYTWKEHAITDISRTDTADIFYTCDNVAAMLQDTIFTVCKEKALTHKFLNSGTVLSSIFEWPFCIYTFVNNMKCDAPSWFKWYDHLSRVQGAKNQMHLNVTSHTHFLSCFNIWLLYLVGITF